MWAFECVCVCAFEPSIFDCTIELHTRCTPEYVQIIFVFVFVCGATFMRRNDVCLFFAKIRSTTQTSTARNEPPTPSLSYSATRSSFSLLESDSFLEIHCAFYRHRVFGEFSNQFSFLFCFRFYCLGFGVHIHFAYTHIWRIFIFFRHDGEVGQQERYFATARSWSALFMTRKAEFERTSEKQTERWRRRRWRCEEVVTSELDGLCESFFSSFLSSSLSVHFIFLFVFWIGARIWNFFSSIFASLQFEEKRDSFEPKKKRMAK